ncbi:oxidoreductase [Aquitalea palustris]|uniref:Oxidoreductase n=1 Tax=Aquitalea palustris TaxID=2480983 RepID=A0A454JHS4_9NEIS|nr:oxidoreductase-like domain-containing protein [Aquitalea palustris]RMC96870.1 oxidoreductase [Aquitalea palustris]
MSEPSPPAADAADPMPEPPFEVSDDMCCGSGCDPCILDTYQAELRDYRSRLAAWQARHNKDGQ